MTRYRKVILGILGALLLLAGLYYRNTSYEYLGLGTWVAGLIYFTFFRKYKEIMSLVLGLLILHAGVVLTIALNQQLPGLLVFTGGIIVVLNSGFSDYMNKKKK